MSLGGGGYGKIYMFLIFSNNISEKIDLRSFNLKILIFKENYIKLINFFR